MQDAVTAGREAGVRAVARHHVPADRWARMASEGAMAYVLRHAHRLTPAHALDIFFAYRAAYLDAAGAASGPDDRADDWPHAPPASPADTPPATEGRDHARPTARDRGARIHPGPQTRRRPRHGA